MGRFDGHFKPRSYGALLFDMDGTLLDSSVAVTRIWGRWCTRYGFDPAAFIPTIHGVRAIDVITRLALPNLDPLAEAARIEGEEMEDVEGIKPIAGAIALLSNLPRDRWAIVTSAPIELARRRMRAAGIPLPDIIVSGEDVVAGKPDPACYLLGARLVGTDAPNCLVFEDATAGIQAAEAAGADVAVVTATHHKPLDTRHRTIEDYGALVAETDGDGALTLRTQATRD